ncbi:hypothetical protein [Streptomyces paromomycinus]|uniref:Uncharacterized protein n=1 Tax=Streptomyces paromomycinus TaxID=92743 RepID=A0A401WEZ0_STREY|nr:hypothetical protein [Streptomyces paromomycinus]GCD47872.1 hypothetical protein GKJPGBOP_07666 [Streptomyces paromomycinus]
MSDQPPPELPPEDGPSITVHVTATGATADYLRQLAAVTGQSPQALAIQWAAGQVLVPETAFGDDPAVPDWPALFEGPPDLSEHAHAYLRR